MNNGIFLYRDIENGHMDSRTLNKRQKPLPFPVFSLLLRKTSKNKEK